jgi:hypothetical protein
MITVDISIKDKKNPPALKFPNRCANCGKPKDIVMPLKLNMGIEKRGQMVMMDMPVPLCKDCEKKEHRVTYVTLIPFIIAVLLIGAVAFVPAWLIAPQGNTPQTFNFDLVFGAFVGLIVGLIGGTVVEFVLKLLFAPVFGQLLLKRSLTVLSLFTDSEDVIGLSAKFKDDRKKLTLSFENDEIAREFKTLNPQEKS